MNCKLKIAKCKLQIVQEIAKNDNSLGLEAFKGETKGRESQAGRSK